MSEGLLPPTGHLKSSANIFSWRLLNGVWGGGRGGGWRGVGGVSRKERVPLVRHT